MGLLVVLLGVECCDERKECRDSRDGTGASDALRASTIQRATSRSHTIQAHVFMTLIPFYYYYVLDATINDHFCRLMTQAITFV